MQAFNKRNNSEWLTAHVKERASGLNDAQVKSVSALMLRLKPESEDLVGTAPKFAALGAFVYEKDHCGGCHQLNGAGGKVGPVLNGLAKRRTQAWTRDHFSDPNKFSPGSVMPPYRFAPEEMQAVLSYLFTLPDQPPAP